MNQEKMSKAELRGEIDQLRQLVVDADYVIRARFDLGGLPDAIDNNSKPYQSLWAQRIVERAKESTEPSQELIARAG